MDRYGYIVAINVACVFYQYKMRNASRGILGLFQSNQSAELRKIDELIALLNDTENATDATKQMTIFLQQNERCARYIPFLISELFKNYGFIISLKQAASVEAKSWIVKLITGNVEVKSIPQSFYDCALEDVVTDRTEFIQAQALSESIGQLSASKNIDLTKILYGHLYRMIRMPWEKLKTEALDLKYIQALRDAMSIHNEAEISVALQKVYALSLKKFNPVSKNAMITLLALHVETNNKKPLPEAVALIMDLYCIVRRYFDRQFSVKRVNLNPNSVSLSQVTKWSVHNPYNRRLANCNLQLYGSYEQYLRVKESQHDQAPLSKDAYAACQNAEEFNRLNDKNYQDQIEAPARAIVRTLYNNDMVPFYSNACGSFLNKGVWWKDPKTDQYYFSSFAHQQTFPMMNYFIPKSINNYWLIFWNNPVSLSFELPWPKLDEFLTLDSGPRQTREDEDGFLCTRFVLIDNLVVKVEGVDEPLEQPVDGSGYSNFQMV